jgi:hypothetical protein
MNQFTIDALWRAIGCLGILLTMSCGGSRSVLYSTPNGAFYDVVKSKVISTDTHATT